MALRNILTKEDETLYKKCRPVTEFNSRLHQLLDDMADTLEKSNGVGLAAPQVGILRRVCVVDIGDGLIELVNPVIIEESGKQNEGEGCLSCPEKYGITDKQIVSVKIPTEGRALVFGDVVARVSDSYALAMHIDTDEANAACAFGKCYGEVIA